MDAPRAGELSAPAPVAENGGGRMEDARPTAVESTSPATTVTDARDFAASTPKAVPKAITEILNQSAPHSGTSTPGFVRTAAEVADSAAILDKEESEPEIPDEEAGRKGVRRMSSTPIAEVAGTAAEVANTAEALDAEKAAPGLELRLAEDDDLEPWELEDSTQNYNETPLFAHECVGMFQSGNAEGTYDLNEPDNHSHGNYYDSYTTDPNDPTLERFPSSWEEIADAVRKLEGGLNEDHAALEGMPLSPPVGSPASRRLSCDPAGDLVASPVTVSPVASRRSRLLEVPRSPHGSVSSDRSSALSLHSIPEAAEIGIDEEEGSYPMLLRWDTAREPRTDAARSCSSDESEGVIMTSSAPRAPPQAAQKQGHKPLDTGSKS